MLDGLGNEAVRLIPLRGAQLERRWPGWVEDREARTQEVGEQVVVAVPAPFVIERHEEDIRLLKALEHPLTVTSAGEAIAQGAGQALEHRRLHQEVARVRIEAREYLIGDVVEDVTMARGEGFDEVGNVRPARERQAGELKDSRPPLGARHERLEFM